MRNEADTYTVCVTEINRLKTKDNNLATVAVANKKVQFFVDLGRSKTLLSKYLYKNEIGGMQPTTVRFRPYGTTHYLETIEELTTTLTSGEGSNHKTMINIMRASIENHCNACKSLDVLNIVPEGKPPHNNTDKQYTVKGIAEELANAGILTTIQKEKDEELS